jgi:D-alanyl-lipoteichoic acid acyltransferase DltB (MBOAT superfamily)
LLLILQNAVFRKKQAKIYPVGLSAMILQSSALKINKRKRHILKKQKQAKIYPVGLSAMNLQSSALKINKRKRHTLKNKSKLKFIQ